MNNTGTDDAELETSLTKWRTSADLKNNISISFPIVYFQKQHSRNFMVDIFYGM